jgi:hypothetical protein
VKTQQFPTAAEVATEMHWGSQLQELAANGVLVDESEFRSRLHWTSRALEAALAANRVFTLEHEGHRYFPAQFIDATTYRMRQLEAITRMLATLSAGGKWLFFTGPKGSLAGRTPLEALSEGKFAAVKRAAEGALIR